MNSFPESVQDIQHYFNESLFPQYDKEEIKILCLLTLEKFLSITRTELRLKSDMKIQEDVAKKFVSVVEELKLNKPIQYILGETEFYGLKFFVDENVLIPRQETEELVDWILNENRASRLKYAEVANQNIEILDIGTGSGCIPISLKKNMLNAKISAIDISVEALKMAKKNALLNLVEIDFIEKNILLEDFLNPTNSNRKGFDIIVSNPPYIRQAESQWMHKNVLDFEPHLALFVDNENPILFYESIATFAKINLKEKGKLYFEINEALGNEVAELLENKGFFNIVVKRDLNGKDRMVRATKEQMYE